MAAADPTIDRSEGNGAEDTLMDDARDWMKSWFEGQEASDILAREAGQPETRSLGGGVNHSYDYAQGQRPRVNALMERMPWDGLTDSEPHWSRQRRDPGGQFQWSRRRRDLDGRFFPGPPR